MKLTHVTLTGTIVGAIWWPIDEECSQDFARTFYPPTAHRADEWRGIRDALMECATTGDFVGGMGDVEEAWITFHYASERRGEGRARTMQVVPTRATRDLFVPVYQAQAA